MSRKSKNILWGIIGIILLGTGIYAGTGLKMSFEEAQQRKESRKKPEASANKYQAISKEQWKSMSSDEKYKYQMRQFQAKAIQEADSNLDKLIKGMKNNTLHPIATGDHPIPSLGTAKDKRAVPYLIEILQKYPEIEVRMKAAEALGNIGEKSAYATLKKALGDKDIQIQLEAAIALTKLGYIEDALPILEMVVKRQDADQWCLDVSHYIDYSNYSAKEKEIKRQELIKDFKNSSLPLKALRYLGEIGRVDALDICEYILSHEQNLRLKIRAGSILMKTSRKKIALPILETIAKNKDINKFDRSSALGALANGGGEREKEIISKYLNDSDKYLSKMAGKALKKMEGNNQ